MPLRGGALRTKGASSVSTWRTAMVLQDAGERQKHRKKWNANHASRIATEQQCYEGSCFLGRIFWEFCFFGTPTPSNLFLEQKTFSPRRQLRAALVSLLLVLLLLLLLLFLLFLLYLLFILFFLVLPFLKISFIILSSFYLSLFFFIF